MKPFLQIDAVFIFYFSCIVQNAGSIELALLQLETLSRRDFTSGDSIATNLLLRFSRRTGKEA